MSGSYTNYLATVTFRPYLQPMPGLGTSARTAGAVMLGGPRAGAGSAVRIYNYLSTRGLAGGSLANLREIARANGYLYSRNARNYRLGI
jgi:hypothetical protein